MNTNTREAGEFQSWDRGSVGTGGEPGPWLPASGAPANETPPAAVECVHCGEPIRWNGSAWTDLDGLNEGCPQRAVDNGVGALPAHEPASTNLDPCLCGDRPQSICEAGPCSFDPPGDFMGEDVERARPCPHGCPNDSFDACDRNGSRLECNSECCPAYTERPTDDARRVERLIWTGIRVGVMQARLASTDLRAFVQGIAALPMDSEHQCNSDYCPDECGGEDDPACQGEPFDLTNDDAVKTYNELIDGARACLRELASAEAKLPGMGGATEGTNHGK